MNQVSEELSSYIKKKNSLDIELYEYARDRFRKDFREAFKDGDRALEDFRNSNKRYQKIAYPIFRLRRGISDFVKRGK